jgi:phosphoribosylaminoimidazole-succinocarboxamide synthase
MVLLYEGKAKQVFNTDCPDEVIIQFKDDATAFNGGKKDSFAGKGVVNTLFTRYFFDILQSHGIKTHVISYVDEISIRAKKVKIFPLEVVVRNFAAGSICKREGYEKGLKFDPPMCEFFLKDDSKGDPLISEAEILDMNLATKEELEIIKQTTLKINSILSSYVDKKGITLVDFKIEFGKTVEGEVILADEISPDTCRFWLKGTTESLDKDVYREDKGDLISSYRRLAEILGV